MIQFVDNIRDLIVEVYTIGYSSKGESQIILLKDLSNSTVLISFLIDCYSTNGMNISIDVLDSNKVNYLDYVIWTHTDEDHSLGFDDIINKYCNHNTKFILPEGIYGNENDFIDYSTDIKSVFNTINSFNRGIYYNVSSVSVVNGGNSLIFKTKFIDNYSSGELVFEVIALTPISAIVRRRWDEGFLKKKNDISISTLFRIGELSLLFGGDIENQSINLIPDFYFDNLTFIKIPHHTSQSSCDIINKIELSCIDNKIPIANTTTFKAHNLPDNTLVTEYLKYIDWFGSTGMGSSGYGYIKTTFNVIINEIEVELFGDAKYFE